MSEEARDHSRASLFVCQLNLIPVLREDDSFADSEAARYSTVP